MIKLLSLVVGSVLAFTAFGGTAAAANENACHGKVASWLNSLDGAFGIANGIQPSDIAKFLTTTTGDKGTAGDVNKIIKVLCAG